MLMDVRTFKYLWGFVVLLLVGCNAMDSKPELPKNEHSDALMSAVAANEDREVLNLLTQGVNPNPTTAAGESALMVAAANGNRRIVRLLLAAGADVNGEDAAGYTPVIHASESGHLSVVRALLAAGANVNVSQNGESLLMKVVGSGDLLTAEMLLAAGADVNYRSDDGRSALDLARARNNRDLEMLLIHAGATR
ncbi:MAG: ankyrin repeat domain-containing protein [Gammaproteobacteria bacterium]|uniref:Ankyrin repeats (3 copies) n=1 Tax=Marinobacter litoralis TaxID=187981 RepID=A0A3M2RCW3_9GAMM|nr:ankyrin repeat domain-containing protein [Marinobacter litoralis]MBR9872010.1 ankyrin repeat domain-containing protein [Gammaproteobacteria bacterium]RMJ03127.1 Ankyrin repeats (3 copies) [Marinobacter litoralis]